MDAARTVEVRGASRRQRPVVRVGLLWIDNNAVQNALQPVAVGRKNSLHLGSDKGGRTAAVLMSLVQSCKRRDNEPFAYLHDILDWVSTHPASRVDDLLPDRRVLPGR